MSVFNPDPLIQPGDRVRLVSHLSSGNTLNEILLHDEVSDDDLKRLVLLERFEGKNRPAIQQKLVGRILSRERARIFTELKIYA